MAEKNIDKIYREEYDNLFYSTYPSPKRAPIKIAANQGVLKRGSLMWQCTDTEDGFKIAETSWTASAGSNCSQPAVLIDDVDTGEGEAVYGMAYLTGHFNLHGLIFKDELELGVKDIAALNQYSIYVSEGRK